MGRAAILVVVSTLGMPACGFEVDAGTNMMVDTPSAPASCNAIKTATPSMPSGTYTIDPDGAGGAAAYDVTCDMTTDGGGWTIVFLAPTNLSMVPISYTSSSPPLLTAAQKAMIAYRGSTGTAASNFATFDMPAAWRTDAPFNSAMNDVPITVSIGGATATPATLRFGSFSFNDRCTDAWTGTNGPWGRICITGTNAPYFSGFATSAPDTCSDSLGGWNAIACNPELRFSIAIR
ncbi:MAG: hypothetical protein H0T46_37205 [Deltaproteobacteria bacterium]|nr:hypothetical protein [Deltaproteobacteria bacterium]